MKTILKGVKLKEVEDVILAMHENPLVGDIIPPAWHQNFPVCGDIRHGQKGRTKRKGAPRRSLQHYLNMHLLAYILSWYRPKSLDDDHGPEEMLITKKFDGDLLRINLKTLALDWRCKKEQISAGLTYLEKIGVIRRTYSNFDFFGTDVKKVVFVLPIMETIKELNLEQEESKCLQNSVESQPLAFEAQDRRSFKRKMVVASSATSSTPEAQNGRSFKRNLSYSKLNTKYTNTTPKATESGVGGENDLAADAARETADVGACFMIRWCQEYKKWFGAPYLQQPGEAVQARKVIKELDCRPKDLLAYAFRMWVNTTDFDEINQNGFDPKFYQIKGSRSVRFFLSNLTAIANEQKQQLDCAIPVLEPDYRKLMAEVAVGRPDPC